MLRAYRNWRRKRILKRAAPPDAAWWATLAHLPFMAGLSKQELERLRALCVLFLHEKHIEGAAGVQVTEPMRLTIAVQACLPILNLGLDYYRGWSSIIVYPGQFVPGHEEIDEVGVVSIDDAALSGESWIDGPLILSWDDARRSGAGDGVNVVIHEFAHKLDMLNGDANGYPPLHPDMDREAWSATFSTAYAEFCRSVENGDETALDPYAAHDPGEFFAVLSEAFFEVPGLVLQRYPEVYRQLCTFYRQHPAQRVARALRGPSW
ncbi:MAG: zinc-dependent peptidase [Burkholderiales bacterium]